MRYENMTLAKLELMAYTTGNKLALAIYEKCHDTLHTEEEMEDIKDAGELRYNDGYEEGYGAGEEDGYDRGFRDGHNGGWSDAKAGGDE